MATARPHPRAPPPAPRPRRPPAPRRADRAERPGAAAAGARRRGRARAGLQRRARVRPRRAAGRGDARRRQRGGRPGGRLPGADPLGDGAGHPRAERRGQLPGRGGDGGDGAGAQRRRRPAGLRQHRPHRADGPPRLGGDRARRQRRRCRGVGDPRVGARADGGGAAAQRRRRRPHRRRGGVPVRCGGVRLAAPAGHRRRRGAQPRGTRHDRPTDPVRDVAGQRAAGRGLRRGRAAPGGDQLRRGGLPDPAERHRLQRDAGRRRLDRPQQRLHRRRRGVPHAAGHP